MKVSELTTEIIAEHLRENPSELSETQEALIEAYQDAAVSYIQKRCNIEGVDEPDSNGRKLDDYPDITIAVLVLIADMYDNRQMTVDSDKENMTVTSILRQHDFNLVPATVEVSS